MCLPDLNNQKITKSIDRLRFFDTILKKIDRSYMSELPYCKCESHQGMQTLWQRVLQHER